MSPQEQSNIKNYLFRRIDNTKLESIIDENYRYVENEFDSDYDFHSFNYGLATIIVEDLHILDFIDLHIEKTYDKLVEYFYIILEDRTRKLYDKLTNNTNLQEQISRMKSMMGVISEKLEDIQGTPLYHKTSTSRGLKIMGSDSLITSRPSDEYLKLDDELRNTEKQSAISFTRDKNWEPNQSIGVGSGSRLEDKHMTFVVDRNKLKTKYKIEPFNYEIIGDRDYRNKGVELPKWMTRKKKNPEMEERVFTDMIYPLHKYVIDVLYTGDDPEIQEYVDGYKSEYLNKSDVTNDFEQLDKEEMKEGEITEKCWKGYTQKGMKTMFGKRYPNCVKKKK